MRILVRVAIAVLVLLGAALGALAFFLPRVVKSDAVRTRIEAVAQQVTGREVRYADLDFALLPPSLVVVDPSVSGAKPGDEPLARAERVALRIALAPLLARAIVIDTLVIDGASLRLERDAKGLVLPRPAKPGAGTSGQGSGGSPVSLALRGLELRDATVALLDRAVTPAASWELRDLDASLRGSSLDEPFDVSLTAELASGGRIQVRGRAGLAGDVDLKLELDALALAPLARYVPNAAELAGAVSGTVTAAGPAASPREVAVDVVVSEGAIRVGEIGVHGKMAIDAGLEGSGKARQGRFQIDATDAEVSYAGVHTRPRGEPKTVTGHVLEKGDGTFDISDWKLSAGPVDAHGSAVVGGKRTRVLASLAPVDLGELHGFVPALADYHVTGPFRLDDLQVATSPLEVRGDIPLDGVMAELPGGGPVRLRGGLVAEGTSARTRSLELVAGDQVVRVDGVITDLAGTPRYRFRTQTQAADTNKLVSTLSANRDRIFGPLDFNGEVEGTLGGGKPFLDGLAGDVDFDIEKGRIVGVSMLEAAFEHFDPGKILGVLSLVGVTRGFDANLQRFYSEEFELLKGSLEIADGIANADAFELAYRDYKVDLTGPIRLADLALDMRGRLTLGAEIGGELAQALSKASGLPPKPGAPAFVIPLPAVQGTLTDPKVRADFGQMTTALLGNVPLVEGILPGIPEDALKGLGDLLGGKRR